MGLVLHERAELAGISMRECVQIAASDSRLFGDAALATPAAVQCLRGWYADGCPRVDLSQIVFRGPNDNIHRRLIATLETLPMSAQWLAVRVLWVSIGGDWAAGWMSTVPAGATQVIALSGSVSAALIPSLVAHELGHALHTDVEVVAETPRLDADERAALQLVAATIRGETVEAAVRRLYRGEILANETAALWGYPSSRLCPDSVRLEHHRDQLLAARSRAAQIMAELEIEQPLAACEIEGAR